MPTCQEILKGVEKDFRNFLDSHYLLKHKKPDFFLHYQRSAQLSSRIGLDDADFRDPARNKILYDATLYCDIGLDHEIKMGAKLSPDEKMNALRNHISNSMQILNGCSFFFKKPALLIAWHHWQPDGKGYSPEKLPAINIYKKGGNLTAISTAFDSIYSRNLFKYNDPDYSLAMAITIIKNNRGKQFSELFFNELEKVLTKGITLNFGSKKITLKTSPRIMGTVNFFTETGIFDYNHYKENAATKKPARKVLVNDLEKFESMYNRGINGELYNINEIDQHIEQLILILSDNLDLFDELLIKILDFASQFKYPDGEIKSFVTSNFFKYLDKYFDGKEGPDSETFMRKTFDLWESYLDEKLEAELIVIFEKVIFIYFKYTEEAKEKYHFSRTYLPEPLKKKTANRAEILTERLVHIYDPAEIDYTKSRISYYKLFLNIWNR